MEYFPITIYDYRNLAAFSTKIQPFYRRDKDKLYAYLKMCIAVQI